MVWPSHRDGDERRGKGTAAKDGRHNRTWVGGQGVFAHVARHQRTCADQPAPALCPCACGPPVYASA